MKLNEQILDGRLNSRLERTLHEATSGLSEGRIAPDHVFTTKEIIEKTNKTERRK